MNRRSKTNPESDLTDELRPEYHVDYGKSRPNRFAGRNKEVVGPVRGGARPGAGRRSSPEPLVAKHVYLFPRHVKILQKIDKNLSAAIRKLVEQQE